MTRRLQQVLETQPRLTSCASSYGKPLGRAHEALVATDVGNPALTDFKCVLLSKNQWGRHMTCWLQQVLETQPRLTSRRPPVEKPLGTAHDMLAATGAGNPA